MQKILRIMMLLSFTTLISCAGENASDVEGLFDEDGQAVLNGEVVQWRDTLEARSVVLVELFDIQGKPLSYCTGALIAKNIVITAAHCFDRTVLPNSGPQFNILFENVYREDGSRTVRRGLKKILHPRYNTAIQNAPRYDHDIALLQFAGDLPSEARVVQIDTNETPNYSSKLITAYGYGRSVEYTGAKGENLRASAGTLRRTTLQLDDYFNYYPDRYSTTPYQRTNLCQGDSGGPQFMNIDGVVKLIGVTSASYGEKLPNGLQKCNWGAGGTKVGYTSQWILQQVAQWQVREPVALTPTPTPAVAKPPVKKPVPAKPKPTKPKPVKPPVKKEIPSKR